MEPSCSRKERNTRIDEVIHQMSLNKCQNNQIGTPRAAKSISGGEMKRLSVASEVSYSVLKFVRIAL